MKSIGKRAMFVTLATTVFAGMVSYCGVLAVGDLRGVGQVAGSVGATGWGVLLSLSLCNYLLRFVRWHGYLAGLGHRVPFGSSALIYLGGFALTTTPGKAGEAIRAVYLKRHGVALPGSLSALFIERLMDMVAIVLLASLVVIAVPQTRPAVLILSVCLVAILPLLRSRRLGRWMGDLEVRLVHLRLRALIGHLRCLLVLSSRLLKIREICCGLAAGYVAWGVEGIGLYLILSWLGADVPVTLAVGIYAASVLVGALSFIPGGLGGTEAAMGLMLHFAGVDLPIAIAATLICRLVTLWFAVVLGFCCLAVLAVSSRSPNRAIERPHDPGV